MSDSVVVRLVRCPKCENLLPELADYSVYQCGGCGAVLRAKVKDPGAEDSDDKSCVEPVGVYATLDDDLSEKGRDEKLEYLSENGVAASGTSNMGVESNVIPSESKVTNVARPDDDIRSQSVAAKEPAMRADPEVSVSGSELCNVEEVLQYVGNMSHSQRSEDVPQWDKRAGEHSQLKGDHADKQTCKSKFQEEGPSKKIPDLSCNYNEEADKEFSSTNGPKRVGKLEKDRAELLQMMEQLRDQLHRSGDLGGTMKGKVASDQNVAQQEPDRSSYGIYNNGAASNTGMHHQYMPDGPYYYPHNLQQHRHVSRHRMGVHNSHPFVNGHGDMPGYGNYLDSRMMRSPFLAPNHYENHLPYPSYHPGHHLNADPSACGPYMDNGLFLSSECSCFECRSLHHIDNTPYFDGRFTDKPNNLMLRPSNMLGLSAHRGHYLRTSGLSSSLNDPSIHVRFADDVKRHTHGYVDRHQQNEVMVKDGLHCQPVAFGAPFVLCHSCSKLLQLPENTFKRETKRHKLRCGGCHSVLYYTVIDNKLTISAPGEIKKHVKDVRNSSDDMIHREISPEPVGSASRKFVSEGFDSSSAEFQAVDDKPLVPRRGLDLTSDETQDSQSLSPSSPASFEGVESPEVRASPPLSGLPVQNQLGHSFNVTTGIWKGSQSTRSDHEKVMPKNMISRQNSLNETSSTGAVEEVSFNVYSDTRVSQKKETTTKENVVARSEKGNTFAGIIKKSLKNISRPNPSVENRDGNVTINGNKIPDRLVKKAEKLAGSIQPGQYWYDSRAGFWGVIGGPCLGIIPPFIEEFNYPMPVNCSAGATGVLVNGRELHQSDLDLLASRGLPTARGRSYIIEISGKVLDADSGGELYSLGRLAPTIEKVKHGFGMKKKAPAR